MKTASLSAAENRSFAVKKSLIKVIIHLTSEKFITFVGVIGVLWSWLGVCTGNTTTLAAGAMVWLLSFAPWAWRETARSLRQQRLGLKQW